MRLQDGVHVSPSGDDELGPLLGTAASRALVTVTETIVKELVVRSRHRVRTYGEVFTPRHMVDRMLDLVHRELETDPDFVDKTFLEPAAGDGNFLVAIRLWAGVGWELTLTNAL